MRPCLRFTIAVALCGAAVLRSGTADAANACVQASSEGQDFRAASKFRAARASFLKCSMPSCNPVVRTSCEKWLNEIAELEPSVVVRVTDARGRDVSGVRVTIDDAPTQLSGLAVGLDPGNHVVRATRGTGEVVEQKVLLAVGEKARLLQLTLPESVERESPPPELAAQDKQEKDEAAAAPRRSLALPFALGAVSVVGLAAFTYFELQGHAGYRALERSCFSTKTCTTPEIDHVKAQFVGAGISIGVAAAALATAVILYLVGGDDQLASHTRAASLRERAFFSF